MLVISISVNTAMAGEGDVPSTIGISHVSPPTIEALAIKDALDNTVTVLQPNYFYKFCVDVRDNSAISAVDNILLILYYPMTNFGGEDLPQNHYTFTYIGGAWNEPNVENSPHLKISDCYAPDNMDSATGEFVFAISLDNEVIHDNFWTFYAKVTDGHNNSDEANSPFSVVENANPPPPNGNNGTTNNAEVDITLTITHATSKDFHFIADLSSTVLSNIYGTFSWYISDTSLQNVYESSPKQVVVVRGSARLLENAIFSSPLPEGKYLLTVTFSTGRTKTVTQSFTIHGGSIFDKLLGALSTLGGYILRLFRYLTEKKYYGVPLWVYILIILLIIIISIERRRRKKT